MIFGVGYLGYKKRDLVQQMQVKYLPFFNNGKEKTQAYIVWEKMLARCYNKATQKYSPTYINCSVCESWHNFQNFAEWFYQNYKENYQLDKDILLKNNKIYSPETCCFIPQEINLLLGKNKAKRGLYPIGVTLDKRRNKFQARYKFNGKCIHCGEFDTPELAFAEYKKQKELHIKEIAEKYYKQNLIEENVYQALIKYQIEITD